MTNSVKNTAWLKGLRSMAGFYTPSAKFAFPRSYAYQIYVEDQAPTITRVGDYIHTDISSVIGYGIWYKIRPQMWNWSSNRYTLDFVVETCWWEAFFDGIHHDQDYVVALAPRGTSPLMSIVISNPYIQTDFVPFAIAQAPSTYWTPTP